MQANHSSNCGNHQPPPRLRLNRWTIRIPFGVPKATLHAEVTKIARRMSRVAADCLKWNQRSINHAFETMGLRNAIMYGAEASAIMDALGSPEADRCDAIRRGEGLPAALQWRTEQFAPDECGDDPAPARFDATRRGWLGREDSNLRMTESKSVALPLGDAPSGAG
jgi:hypothetical protein